MNTNSLSRRRFLAAAPQVVTGAAIGAGALGLASGIGSKASAQEAPTFPWPYQELDPNLVAKRAYAGYNSGKGCMYGAFEGLIGELRETVGYPFTIFPVNMMEYGKGGVNGIWGTLCGSLNAASAAINLVSSTPAPLINEVYFWYCQESLPGWKPETPKYQTAESVAGSPICHVSVQRWCEVSGFKPTSPERAERCACVTAAVAKYTAELLNKNLAGSFSAIHKQSGDAQHCMACHGKGAQENVNQGGNMSCTQCHTEVDEMHPRKHLQIRWSGSGILEKADAVTGPWAPTASPGNTQPISPADAAKFFRLK